MASLLKTRISNPPNLGVRFHCKLSSPSGCARLTFVTISGEAYSRRHHQKFTVMKNHSISLTHYWNRCRKGLPVSFSGRPGRGLILRLESAAVVKNAASLVYARLDEPTGRLLLHFVRTAQLIEHASFKNDVLQVPVNSVISPSVARLLRLPGDRYHLRPGNYPLLTDEQFSTASVRLIRMQRAEVSAPAHRQQLPG